jgi:Ser/Thr protein kinase RdoA (MazF antagonist)
MLKRIDVTASGPSDPAARPAHVYDGLREALVYRTFLHEREPAAPFFYGVVRVQGESPGSWLLLDRIRGRELYQFEAIERWEDVGRWLAGFHSRGRSIVRYRVACRAANLLEHTPSLLYSWLDRAASFAETAGDTERKRALERLRHPLRRAVERTIQLPGTLIHGDFYPSNILLVEGEEKPTIHPVDWELAGHGPGLLDLAALISGDWDEPAPRRIANAYRSGLPADERLDPVTFARALQACRLIVAVQWLGWSPDWEPPPEHRTDWLTAAADAAAHLDEAELR